MRFAYLTPRDQYLTKMSRVRFHQIKAIAKVSDLIWSGPGWDNYDDTMTVTQNLCKIYDNNLPDMVIVFDHRPMLGFLDIPIAKCLIMNEMHGPTGERDSSIKLMRDQGYDIIICHHLNEMMNPVFVSQIGKCVNLPHCAEKTIFKDYGNEKIWDVICCGNLRFDKYALRRRYPVIISKMNKMGYRCKVYQHPGGFHKDAYTDRYLIDFAQAINQAKICLTCSSIYKCAFGKYVEIPMCRSLLSGDLPNERQDFFREFMLVIEDNDTDQQIIDKLVCQLNDIDGLMKKTEIGYRISHENYTMEKYAERFISVARRFLFSRRLV